MFKRFMPWHNQNQKNSYYSIDQRNYKPLFGAGFFGFLDRSNFWQNPFKRLQNWKYWRSLIFRFLTVSIIILLIWAAYESFRALRHL